MREGNRMRFSMERNHGFAGLLLICAACSGDAAPGTSAMESPQTPSTMGTPAGAKAASAGAPASGGGTAGRPPSSATTQPSAGSSAAAGTRAAAGADAMASAAGAGGGLAVDPATPPAAPETITLMVDPEREHMYDDATNWLCLPGMKDELCTTGLDTTIVRADGTTEVEKHVVAAEPAFDCFYVYPTVSNDPGSNSDLRANQEENDVVHQQAGRYSRECRLFAPIYRQVTLGALNGGTISDEARMIGYLDVIAAFNRYLTEYNKGRGFVLIGHSQGAGVLRRLIVGEIDAREPLRKRLIAAHLLGTSLPVPEGADVGGDFKNVPVCRADDQFGCVIAYATFRADSPPPSNSRFGKAMMGRAACANPAALGGGKGILIPYLAAAENPGFARGGGMQITTEFVNFPDFLEAECTSMGEFTYLALTVLADRNDPRADDIGGDITADWGLHLVDVHIAMGNLVNLAASEYKAFAAANP
jgi:hypothetical protein